jgi:hypothetical protein
MGGQTRVDELGLGLARAAIHLSNEAILFTFEDMDRTAYNTVTIYSMTVKPVQSCSCVWY